MGKADPKGSRKGLAEPDLDDIPLMDRINEHRNSIRRAASTLAVADFYVRYLVTDEMR